MNSKNDNTQLDTKDTSELFQQFANLPKRVFPKLKTARSVNLFGIDSLKIGFHIHLSEPNLKDWLKNEKVIMSEFEDKLLSRVHTRKHQIGNGSSINFAYIPVDYQGKNVDLLIIELHSVPKLLGVCNHSQIQDWEQGWDRINQILSDIPFLVEIPDVRDGIIYRIDVCANFQVGKNVNNFMDILCKRHFPHRTIQTFPGKQVIFGSKEISTSFYNKHRLCKKDGRCYDEDAVGILRMETQIRTKRKAQEWFRLETPTLRMITKQRIIERLEQDLITLKLDKPVLGNLVERIKTSSILSKTEIRNLIAYVTLRDTSSHENLKQFYSPKMRSDREKMLLEAGLSGQTVSNLKTALPSLLYMLALGNIVETEAIQNENDEMPDLDMDTLIDVQQNKRNESGEYEFEYMENCSASIEYDMEDSLVTAYPPCEEVGSSEDIVGEQSSPFSLNQTNISFSQEVEEEDTSINYNHIKNYLEAQSKR